MALVLLEIADERNVGEASTLRFLQHSDHSGTNIISLFNGLSTTLSCFCQSPGQIVCAPGTLMHQCALHFDKSLLRHWHKSQSPALFWSVLRGYMDVLEGR